MFKKLISSSVLFAAALFCTEISAKTKAPVTTPISPEIEKRLTNIERLLQSNGLLDMLQQIDSLQREVAKLSGDIEMNNHITEIKQRDLYTDIYRRLQRIEEGSISSQLPSKEIEDDNPPLETLGQMEIISPPENQKKTKVDAITLILEKIDAQKPETQIVNGISDPERMIATETTVDLAQTEPIENTKSDDIQEKQEYDKAFRLLKKSLYNQAIKAFRAFLQTYINSQYSDNAQYWIAEALYVQHLYEDAITEYSNLLNQYPDSKKVSHSFLKIGYSYQALNRIIEAKLWYDEVGHRFPDTTASRLADDRLKNFNEL